MCVAVLIFWFACFAFLFELCTVSKKRKKGLTSDTDRFACQEALELNALNMKYMSLSAILIAFLLGLNQAHSPGCSLVDHWLITGCSLVDHWSITG